ncbi:AsmA family protein [Fodinibius salinus]|uniref:AsmA family protein n=1 Tax=Fodinibius salinus TaxID=860790 RepID=A0A5D3YJF7_9BACT|nr:AsmA family protein [Fodinibius salinus]TYP93692.1 AsmA family protein [Fodinibius salinus]
MKPVFQALFGLIIVSAIGALILSFSLDGMVKSNLESTATEMLDTSVDVNDVSISILDGSGSIKGITIANPQGFSDSTAVELKEINMKVDLYSLLSDTVVVNKIQINKPELHYEQKTTGSNFDALTSNMKSDGSSKTYLAVDYLLVKNGRISLSTDIGGSKSMEAEFSQIEIEGIGRDRSSTTKQALRQILEPILKQAAQEAVKSGLKNKAKDVAEDLLDG